MRVQAECSRCTVPTVTTEDAPASPYGPLFDPRAAVQVARDCGWTLPELGRSYYRGVRRRIREIHQAVAVRDESELRRLAHGCAGSSLMSGAPGIGARFRLIEHSSQPFELAPAVLEEIESLLEEVREAFGASGSEPPS